MHKGAHIYTHVCAHTQKLCACAQTKAEGAKIILHSINTWAAQTHMKNQCIYI